MQGRLTGKQYPDTSTVTYAYETTTSRLKSVTEALNQVKTNSYAKDDRLLGIAYTGAVNPTPNVGFTLDPYFPRLRETGRIIATHKPARSFALIRNRYTA